MSRMKRYYLTRIRLRRNQNIQNIEENYDVGHHPDAIAIAISAIAMGISIAVIAITLATIL